MVDRETYCILKTEYSVKTQNSAYHSKLTVIMDVAKAIVKVYTLLVTFPWH